MSGLGLIEILLVAGFLVAPLVFATRLAKRHDPRPVSVGLLLVAGLLAAATVVFPLFYLIAVPAGGMIVARGRRDGWLIVAVAVVGLVIRVIVFATR